MYCMISVCRSLNADSEGTVYTGEVYVCVLLIMADLLVTSVIHLKSLLTTIWTPLTH